MKPGVLEAASYLQLACLSDRASPIHSIQGCSKRIPLQGQDLPRTYLAHHELESVFFISAMIILNFCMQVRDMPDGSARWIAKPSITNQATGICIFDRVSQLVAALHANEDLREWVLQR